MPGAPLLKRENPNDARTHWLGAHGRGAPTETVPAPGHACSRASVHAACCRAQAALLDYAAAMASASAHKGTGETYLFSGYARLPQDVSHQPVYGRVGVVLEVDGQGVVVGC